MNSCSSDANECNYEIHYKYPNEYNKIMCNCRLNVYQTFLFISSYVNRTYVTK